MNSMFLTFLNEHIKLNMKNNEQAKLKAFRNIKADYVYLKEKTNCDTSEIIKKLYNERKNNSEIYKNVNEELYNQEVLEMSILEPYLPEEINKEELFAFFDSLNIEKQKSNFKLFLNAGKDKFQQAIDSKYILEYLNK